VEVQAADSELLVFGRLGLLICAVAAASAFVGGRVCWSINHKQFNHK
jgi:hypothetical protein